MSLENVVFVKSQSDCTLVIDVPDIPLRRTWTKRGVAYPIDREQLTRAFYDASVEYLFKAGLLITDDKEFLKEVGLMGADEQEFVLRISDTLFARMIHAMPLSEFKTTLAKMSREQVIELADYAIENYKNFNLDRIDILTQASGKNILKAIEQAKADLEG